MPVTILSKYCSSKTYKNFEVGKWVKKGTLKVALYIKSAMKPVIFSGKILPLRMNRKFQTRTGYWMRKSNLSCM